MNSRRIVAFDTSLVSENGGDSIIMKYINEVLDEIFPSDFVVHIPSHDSMGSFSRNYCKEAAYKIMCGTNILTADMVRTKMWNVSIKDIPYIKDTILLGAGWREYEGQINFYTQWFWKKVLNKKYLHSVRDEYTKKRLEKMGINNVINTACPTMWNLTEDFCSTIETTKQENVITTLTNYRTTTPEVDYYMLNVLHDLYKNVYIWIQALEDIEYLKKLNLSFEPIIISPGLQNYEKALQLSSVEYCGTRLHAGIEALNHKIRTLIIAKDNRALEISKDTNLPVISESQIQNLKPLLLHSSNYRIQIPTKNIERWKQQFKSLSE